MITVTENFIFIYEDKLMKILACYDEKNYSNTTKVYEKYSIRGIVMIDGKLAMQRSSKGEYKVPGGGLEAGETHEETLRRELDEEVGLVLVEGSLKELGEITEIRRDIFEPDTKYICHSVFYACEVTEERRPIHPSASELKKGYHLEWATPEEICKVNDEIATESWIKRDTALIRMILEGKFEQIV